MKFGIEWSSFFPVLIKAVQNTDGPVLELGSGLFSTPLLHWLCAEKRRKLITYEDNQKYYKFARKFRTDTHEVKFVTDWKKEDFDNKQWDVALIDHMHTKRDVNGRTKDILRLKNCVKFIVIHDTQKDRWELYGYDKLWIKFKNVYHYKLASPPTSIVSNLSDLKIFK